VIACERRVGPSVLTKLVRSEDKAWIAQCLDGGLLIDAGVVHSLSYTRSLQGERAVAIAPSSRPLLLRRLADLEELEAVRRSARAVIGEGNQAGFMTTLYEGDWGALDRAVLELTRRTTRTEAEAFAQDMLREAVCVAFDADWLERTWGEWAPRLVLQALSDALGMLEEVSAAYRWWLIRFEDAPSPSSARVLAEHALLRGEAQHVERLIAHLAPAERRAFEAASAYVSGDASRSYSLSTEPTDTRTGQLGSLASTVTAVLALLHIARDAAEGARVTKRLLTRVAAAEAPPLANWPGNSAQAALGRALRSLLRRSTQPEHERSRLSAHQLAPRTDAWEVLLAALSVNLLERDEVTRGAWARRLASDATRAQQAGYAWFAGQAWQLAKTLSEESATSLPTFQAPDVPLFLADLLEPQPEWKRALEALAAFTQNAERAGTSLTRRVAFYVDMARGEPARPALEEFVVGSGWTRTRRADLAELAALKDTLPPEDVSVLRALEPLELAAGDLPLELLEALVGHPRVFNGARGRLPVQVLRGQCHIETRTEHGHLLLHVHPAGAREGLNVVTEGETRLLLYRVNAALAKLIQTVPVGVRVPEQHQREALAVLARLAEHVEIRSAELGARRRVAAESTPVLRIAVESGAFWVELGVRPFGADGRFFLPGAGRQNVTAHDGGALFDSERNPELERTRAQGIITACPALQAALTRELEVTGAQESFTGSLGEEELLTLLGELRDSALPCSIEWKNARPLTASAKVSVAQLRGKLRRIKGWYLVTGGIDVDGVTELSLAQLIQLPFTQSGRFVRLPNGDFLELEQRVRRVVSALRNTAELSPGSGGASLRVPDSAFSTLRTLLESGGELSADAAAREWLDALEHSLQRSIEPPDALNATLRTYQLEGYRWLWRMSQLGLGVCLADDMGLGKTLQVLALLLTRAEQGPALVVAPTSVCGNWLSEVRRFAPSLRVEEYTGKTRAGLLARLSHAEEPEPPQLIVTSYALLQQDAAELARIEWHTVVLDEAQFIKNAHSLRAKAAFALSAHYRVALTGTPIENHLGDLWSLFHFLNPSLLGTWKHFQLRYLTPIEREQDHEQRAALRNLIHPYLLRRRKDEVLRELPALTVLNHEVELSADESLRYALLRRQVHDKLKTPWGKRQHKLQIFSEITRLRRFCCHPRLVFPEASAESSKLQVLFELVEELRQNGHRALVFSQFVDFLQLVREELDERKISYVYLDGATPKEHRPELVASFQAGEADLFLISLKAGGFGLNLTAADYVIHLDPWWNPAVEAQASDRAHRIGQEHPVTVYRLVTRNTIEERILALHNEKRSIADTILEGTDAAADLTTDQLLSLLDG